MDTMSETESSDTPPIPREPWYRVSWARISSRWKWPGWAALALWIVIEVPDWYHRLDFWLGTVAAMGGYLGAAALVVGSAYFRWAILVAAISYLVLIGEPKRGVQRHPWWPIIGWVVFGLCFTAIIMTLLAGYFEMRVQRTISETPLSVSQRRLSEQTQACLKRELPTLQELTGKRIVVDAVNGDREAMKYAEDFLTVFADLGILSEIRHPKDTRGKRFALPIYSDDPTMHGVFLGVPDQTNPLPQAKILQSALSRCGIAAAFIDQDRTENEPTVIIDQPP